MKREYLRKLECLPKLTDPNDFLKLRSFADELDICCNALTEYGIDSDSQDIILLNTVEKLPHDLRYQFTKSLGGIDKLNLTKPRNLLHESIWILSQKWVYVSIRQTLPKAASTRRNFLATIACILRCKRMAPSCTHLFERFTVFNFDASIARNSHMIRRKWIKDKGIGLHTILKTFRMHRVDSSCNSEMHAT